MALIYRAEIQPSKVDLITAWAPAQPWFVGEAGVAVTNLAAYRFDDPAGAVGIETILVRAGTGPVLQVPLTYRDAPLAGAEAALITTMQHSVLGERWVYDATADPVYIAAAATIALTGGRQADLQVETDGELVLRDPTAVVAGSGSPDNSVADLPEVGDLTIRHEHGTTVVDAGGLRLVLARVLGDDDDVLAADSDETTAREVLAGTWPGQADLRTLLLVERLDG